MLGSGLGSGFGKLTGCRLWSVAGRGLALALAGLAMAAKADSASRDLAGPWRRALSADAAKVEDDSPSAPWRFAVVPDLKNEFFLDFPAGDWAGWEAVEWRFQLPDDWPSGGRIYFYGKDWDHLWRQLYFDLPGRGRFPR